MIIYSIMLYSTILHYSFGFGNAGFFAGGVQSVAAGPEVSTERLSIQRLRKRLDP